MRKLVISLLILGLLWLTVFSAWGDHPVYSGLEIKSYHVEKFNFKIDLPDTTVITEDYLDSKEIQFNASLSDQSLGYWGYIQFWNIPALEEFIIKSKETSAYPFYSFDYRPIQLNSLNGFKADWTAKMHNGLIVTGQEYYLAQGERVCVISFMAEGKIISEELQRTISSSLSSVQWGS